MLLLYTFTKSRISIYENTETENGKTYCKPVSETSKIVIAPPPKQTVANLKKRKERRKMLALEIEKLKVNIS